MTNINYMKHFLHIKIHTHTHTYVYTVYIYIQYTHNLRSNPKYAAKLDEILKIYYKLDTLLEMSSLYLPLNSAT